MPDSMVLWEAAFCTQGSGNGPMLAESLLKPSCCWSAGDASLLAKSQAAPRRGPFGDYWFTLAALEVDPEEKQRVRELIRRAGGRIFDEKRVDLVTSRSSAYAVCPMGFPPPLVAEAMRQPDFKMGE